MILIVEHYGPVRLLQVYNDRSFSVHSLL